MAGTAVYPIMTAPTGAGGDVDQAATVANSTGTFAADALTPRRIQRSFTANREDLAGFPMMEDSIRRHLADALSAGLDEYVLTKDAAGLLAFGTDPTAPGSTSNVAAYIAGVTQAVDGRHAYQTGDVRLLVGASTYGKAAAAYRATASNETAADWWSMKAGGYRVSDLVPAPASNIQQAVAARMMGAPHAFAPVWDGVEIIFDPYTLSGDGQVQLTGVMLMNFATVRKTAYRRVSFHTG